LGTDWHPDPDGDGIASASDVCPHIYDVDQGDADGDGVGDYCDADFVNIVEDAPVVDLRAQHVTPYGGWFNFTDTITSQYGNDYLLAWSQNRNDVSTGQAIAALDSANTLQVRSYAYFGDSPLWPQIITSMEPDTTYFLSVVALDFTDAPVAETSNIIEIRTAPAPSIRPAEGHPRAWATAAQLEALKTRNMGDAAWAKWKSIIGPYALSNQGSTAFEDFESCLAAAVLFHATGEDGYKQTALSLIDAMLDYWQSNTLERNQLRWADSNLPICTDLMWNELSPAERNTIVAAYLEDDEIANLDRLADTDEFASITRSWVIDGLIACEASGLNADLSQRGCALLEKGLRSFYGVQLVKARRDHGFFAQSGGHLPDGQGYAMGTTKYWMHTLHALNNVSDDVKTYAAWVYHNLLSHHIYPLTPMRRGYATFGDLDSYDNFSVEPNSHPLVGNGGLLSMQMGVLESAGLDEAAGNARWHLHNLLPENKVGHSWAMLFYDHEGIAEQSNDSLKTSHYDSGMEMFYDRTNWSDDASFLTFRAGWSGVDHNHQDLGAFQFYRKGVWITNEALGYDGPSSTSHGHNVPELEIAFDDGGSGVGQFAFDASHPTSIQRVSSSEAHTLIASDLRGAYSSGRHHSFLYDALERHVFWIKASEEDPEDRVFVYDLIDSADLVHPVGASLQYQPPEGVPTNYPGEIYTGRLLASEGAGNADLRYLSIIRAGDSATERTALAVESDEMIGVLSGQDLVLFPRIASALPEEMSVSVDATDVKRVWWSGLLADTGYSLSASTGGGKTTLTLSKGGNNTTDDAGLLTQAF
jgi:hypothetical protein